MSSIDWATATEQELRDAEAPRPQTAEELAAFVQLMATREHDYGTCVYAMSLSAVAAFNYIAHVQGVTGFQASCADLDIVRRTRHLEHGGGIQDYGNLLYPQYCNARHFPSAIDIIRERGRDLAKAAQACLAENGPAHPTVRAHWQWLAADPFASERPPSEDEEPQTESSNTH
jgi:hypothetical protein